MTKPDKMNNMIAQRLKDLREVLQREHLAAFIFPSTDPHQSEYTAEHWKGRQFISGFDGSAGTAVVTMTSAALWTDSRYFLQAEEQLRGTEFQLMRLKMEGTPTIAEWINAQCSSLNTQTSTEVGVDGMVCSVSMVEELTQELRQNGGLTLRTNFDPLRLIWSVRPALPADLVTVHPIELAGETVGSKLSRIRQALRKHHADGMLMAALDDIAWTLNLRGTDVHCNPVFVAYLLISSTSVTLYINKQKLTAEVMEYLRQNGVGVDDYGHVTQGLRDYFELNILMDPDEVCHTLYKATARPVVRQASPVPAMKAVKNQREQEGFRQAMLRDGVAMVQFLKWLSEFSECSENSDYSELSELSVCSKLEQLRASQPLYRGLSFDTISAYAAHGAIVHYEPTPQTDIPLYPRGLLLLDSGAQYADGTTDITRTIALGPLTDEERRVYTLVLKGHLQLQNLVFPDGAAGTQLDAVARTAMWREGYNYLHGTGHGVGSYLCVHEGPHQIRMEWRPAPLRAGMTVTCEPGIYLAGRFGVRIENTLLVMPAMTTACGTFLRFEPLTLCPIDISPVIPDMLTAQELQWLNDYHQLVFSRLAPHLDASAQAWLEKACQPLE